MKFQCYNYIHGKHCTPGRGIISLSLSQCLVLLGNRTAGGCGLPTGVSRTLPFQDLYLFRKGTIITHNHIDSRLYIST